MSTSGAPAWAARGMTILPGLAPRPQHHIQNKQSAIETVNSTSKALFVFVKECQDSEIHVLGKIGKITVENGRGLEVFLSDHVVGGTMELIRCENIHIHLGLDAEVGLYNINAHTA